MKVRQHRSVQGDIKTITVKREGRRWYVLLSCDNVPKQPLPLTGVEAGVDVGINVYAMIDDGYRIENPRHARAVQKRMTELQQSLARKKRGGSNRNKTRQQVAQLHRKIRCQREDFQHKAALELVRRYDTIYLEDLSIANMVRRPTPRPDGEGGYAPNGAAGKSGLNRSINDAAWGGFINKICDKAESAGRSGKLVDPRYTSQTCPSCGHVSRENRNGVVFLCIGCGHRDHADKVGAYNIKTRGQDLTSGTVSASSRESPTRRPES